MPGIVKTSCIGPWIAFGVTFTMALLLTPVCGGQALDTDMLSREPSDTTKPPQPEVLPPAAPVPAPIMTARKAFVSNLGGDSELIYPDHYSGGPDRTYNQFYAAMKGWGRYELVSAPADADLILEIRLTAPVGPANVVNGSGGSWLDPQFRLAIIDPKTRAVLWAFTEHVTVPHATHDQSFDQAMAKLVNDFKKLAAPPPIAADPQAK